MQVCTSLQTDNHASTTQFFTGRMPFLPPNQQRQSTEGNMIGASLQKIWKSHSTKVLPPNQQRQSTEGTQLFTQWRQNVRAINVIFNADSRLPSCFVVPNFTLIDRVAVVWTIVNCEFVEIGEIHLPNRGMFLGVLLAIFFSGRGGEL